MADEQFTADSTSFKKLGAAAKGVDKRIKKEFNKALRDAGKPLGKFVAASAGSNLPQRGGLGYRVAGANVTVATSTLKATVNLKTREGYDLKGMDKGTIRHPVYGNKNAWVGQTIQPRLFSDPFDEAAPIVRKEMLAAGQRVLDQMGE